MTLTRNKVKVAGEVAVKPSAEIAVPGSKTLLARLKRPGNMQTALICVVIFVLAMGVNLYRIGDPSLWFDETLSVTRAQQSLPVLFQIVAVTQPNMALYYFVLHFWLGLMGLLNQHPTEVVVRFPSAVFSALDTLIIYWLARRFFGTFVAIFASLLYLLNMLQLTYAQETRSYTLQILFLNLSWLALCVLFSSDLSRKRARNWWLCFIVSSVLAIYAQLFTELVFATQLLAIVLLLVIPNVWRTRVRKQIRPLFVSGICIGILIAPLLYASRVGSKTGWLPIPRPGDVYHLFLTISSQSQILLGLFALVILLGLCVALLAVLPRGEGWLRKYSFGPVDASSEKQWKKRFVQLLPLAIVLVCWLLCPVAISYVVSQRSTHLFSSRYLVVIVPAFILLAALGISTLRWRIAQIALSLCLLFLCLFNLPYYYSIAQVEDWRTGTQWLQQYYRQGDGIICYDNSQGCAVDIEYYLQAYPSGDAHFDADSPGYFPWVSYDTTNQLGNYKQALDINAIQAYGNEHARLFYALGRADPTDPAVKAVIQWLNSHYKPLAQEVTPTLTIYLYDTTAYQPHLV